MKILKWTAIAFCSFIALSIVVGRLSPNPKTDQPAVTTTTLAPVVKAPPDDAPVHLPRFTPKDLQQAYEANSVAADAKFKSKRFIVTGSIKDISTDFMGTPYVTLSAGTNVFTDPHFSFDKKHLQVIAELKKGQKIELECEGNGDVIKTSMNKECRLI
jgi:tRNA_anti-like